MIQDLEDKLSKEAYANLIKWLSEDEYLSFRDEINLLIEQKKYSYLEDSFYKHIEIGTGGIRGSLGPGPNKINLRTIGEAAQALCQFMKEVSPESMNMGVVIGHEVRKNSVPFASLCASVLAANGIKSYLFDSFRSTPEISFAVRHLGAVAGIQLTASHNPRTDNGFKFYWTDGGQVVPPLDQKFMELVQNVAEVKQMGFEEAKVGGYVTMLGEDIDKIYWEKVRSLSVSKSRSAKIVFSPIHGAGSKNVLPVLTQEGFDVFVVPEQADPDENFPTAVGDLINPEYIEVMELPMKYGREKGADLVINSDPDADRIGVASKIKFGASDVRFLTGNQLGILLTEFLLKKKKESGELKSSNLILETYVTTSLISKIVQSYGIKVVDDLLVGFKFIAEIIQGLNNKNDFLFAAEESLGYLAGSFVRDKDASIAALLASEMASELKDQGKTLVDYLDEIYAKYGYFKNILNMVELPGKEGAGNIRKIMLGLRNHDLPEIGGKKVLRVIDRLPEEKRDESVYKTGSAKDMITFVFSDDELCRITARPSGTEPKVKYYIQFWGDFKDKESIDRDAENVESGILEIQKKIIDS